MLAKSSPDGEMANDQQGHPVIRTLYDHADEVTCMDFHPREPILASGSRDFTVKLFDFSKAAAKKAFKTLAVSPFIIFLSITILLFFLFEKRFVHHRILTKFVVWLFIHLATT